jgi:hypothetical protein
MIPEQAQDWRQIAAELKRRRNRELVAAVPLFAAVIVFVQLLHDSSFEIGGLGGLPLLVTALAVVAGYTVHHLTNWRCPACRHYLGKLGATLCNHCGATFTAPPDQPLMDEAVARQEQQRRAVQAEVAMYRTKAGMGLLKGLVAALLGGVMILLAESPETVKPDSVLYRWFGESGAHLAVQLFGGFIVLTGVAWMGYALWRQKTGARRYAERLQSLVDARPGGGTPPAQPAMPAADPWQRR